jgi:hypothetical protein
MILSYEERLKLIGLTCQVSHGKFDPQTAPPLGVLDVIGKDRRYVFPIRYSNCKLGTTSTDSVFLTYRLAWQAVGDKTKADSMFEFITTLNKQSPLFKPYVEAHKRDGEEKSRISKAAQNAEDEKQEDYQIAKEIERQAEEEKCFQEEQKRRVQDALNRQTFAQFKTYAEQQYPGNPEQVNVICSIEDST